MKIYIGGNKWLLRVAGAVMFFGPPLVASGTKWGYMLVLALSGKFILAFAALACMVFGLGVAGATFFRGER